MTCAFCLGYVAKTFIGILKLQIKSILMVRTALVFGILLVLSTTGRSAPLVENAGETLDERWLVILGALDHQDRPPENWPETEDKLKKVGASATTTWSSYFKGLMPCWHIIVGGDFATQNEAKSWSKKLKKAGIHNYFKHAGRYLGPDPRIAAACAEQKNPSATDGALYPALQLGGRVLVPVSAPAAILERAMEKAGPLRAIDEDKNAWKQKLVPLRVGKVSVGQTLSVAAPSPQQKSQDCKVKGFVALTWGTPHFGWQQNAAQATKPGCGTAQVMAELNCDLGRENALSVAYAPGKKAQVFPLPPKPIPTLVLPDSAIDLNAELRSARARGQEVADEGDGVLVTETTAYQLNHSDYVVQNYGLYTGEGQAFCGGDDFVETHSALVQKGKLLTSFIDTTLDDMKAIVKDGANFYFLTFGSSGALLLRDDKGNTRGKIAKGFCDCGC